MEQYTYTCRSCGAIYSSYSRNKTMCGQCYALQQSATQPSSNIAVDVLEVWQEFSEYVDDDIDSLQRYAGRDVMLYDSFLKAAEKLPPSNTAVGQFQGSVFQQPAPGVAIGCISPEARDLLDTIMKKWEKHYAGLKETAGKDYDPTFYGFAYWLCRWSGLVQPAEAASTPQGAVEQTTVFVPCDQNDPECCGGYQSHDGQGMAYVKEVKVPVVVNDAVWLKGEYERLYDQIKSGKQTVCYVDYSPCGQGKTYRDICVVRRETMQFSARGIGYGGGKYTDAAYEKKEFLQECECLNVEWLDESRTTPSNQSDAVEFLTYLISAGFYMQHGTWRQSINSSQYTTAQLYELFKNRNHEGKVHQ